MSDDMDTADVLDAAADYLRIHGWVQGKYGEDGAPRCAHGAIRALGASNPVRWTAVAALNSTLGLDSSSHSIEAWNDVQGRTAAEVVTALMEAATRVRTGEVQP